MSHYQHPGAIVSDAQIAMVAGGLAAVPAR